MSVDQAVTVVDRSYHTQSHTETLARHMLYGDVLTAIRNTLKRPEGEDGYTSLSLDGGKARYFFSLAGVYHTGDVQARCCTVAATFGFGGRFSLAAQ